MSTPPANVSNTRTHDRSSSGGRDGPSEAPWFAPALRDRLLALAQRPDREAVAAIVPDVAHWATQTTRARKGLAHEGRTADYSVAELFTVVEVTTAVVILNVLHELGASAEGQREIAREWLLDSEG